MLFQYWTMPVTIIMAAHFHSVPGRLRVHVPRVKGNVASARAVEATLSKLNSVSHVEGRELTGSVVIHYDPKAITGAALLAAIGVNPQHVTALGKPRQAPAAQISTKIAGKIAEAALWHLIETAAQRAVPLLIAAIL